MRDSARHLKVKIQQGAYLPHWTVEDAIYHIVFRLGDALPAAAVNQYRVERESLPARATRQEIDAGDTNVRPRVLFSERIERLLDQGLGACWLARENIAVLAADALLHFNEVRYVLHAWCVMPNHVHVVVQPKAGQNLPAILKSWKGFIALRANRYLSRTGEFWQPEYYDHIIRNETELARAVRYVQENPRKAGMTNWRWVWPRPE